MDVSVSEKSSASYTHRLPSETGSGFENRDSTAASRQVTATASAQVAPTTALGEAIFAAAWGSPRPTVSATATERRDATIEGGATSW